MKKFIVLISVLALVLLAACDTRVIMPEDVERNVLSVQGSSEFEVAPDEAKIRVRIDTRGPTASEAQDANRQVANSVRSAIRNAGVRDSDIETAEYRVSRLREWDSEFERQVDRGFQAYNVFVVTMQELENVGRVLDAAGQAGAVIDNVQFTLSESLMDEVREEALRQAAGNAKLKAQALAEGLGVRISKVDSASEGHVYMPMARAGGVMMASMDVAEAAPTPIEPSDVQVRAQVSVSYEIA